MLIAIGTGPHNLGAWPSGNSAAKGEFGLALLLVIGSGTHSATEGFRHHRPDGRKPVPPVLGLPHPARTDRRRPTVADTLVGQSIAFLALTAGSILVVELLAMVRKPNLKVITTWEIFLGVVAGFLSAIVTAAGA